MRLREVDLEMKAKALETCAVTNTSRHHPQRCASAVGGGPTTGPMGTPEAFGRLAGGKRRRRATPGLDGAVPFDPGWGRVTRTVRHPAGVQNTGGRVTGGGAPAALTPG